MESGGEVGPVPRAEFDDFRSETRKFHRESRADREAMHREIRDAAGEIRGLRDDLILIAKLGGVLISVLATVAPVATLIITIAHR